MDEIEFEEMIHIHGPDILRFCRMTTGSTLEGDELYQDTLLKLWEKRDKLAADAKVKSYALSIAIRIWKNKRRKSAWRNRIAPQTSYEQILENGDTVKSGDSSGEDPLQTVIADEQTRDVRAYVRELPEKYRQVLYLYYSSDLSTSEIAGCLHISVNTVKTRLTRARAILKKRLEVEKNE